MNTLQQLQASLEGSCLELASYTAVEEPARNSAEREVWAANPSRHGWIWPFSFGTQSKEGCVYGLLGQHGLNCFDFFGQLLTSQLVHTQPYDLESLFGSGSKKMFHFVSEQPRRPFEEGIERLRSFKGQVGSGPKWSPSPARRGRDLEKGECSTQSEGIWGGEGLAFCESAREWKSNSRRCVDRAWPAMQDHAGDMSCDRYWYILVTCRFEGFQFDLGTSN